MKSPQRLTVFRNSFVGTLRTSIQSNLSKYQKDDEWASSIGSRGSRDLETRLELTTTLELVKPLDGETKDLENAIRMHKALRQLTPLQARDPRLWTRFAHIDFWDYIRKRWPAERHEKDKAKAARYIETHYFVPQSQSRALLRNGVARLWWTAYLSHDETRSNPYELTSVLFSTLDITQQILERGMGRSPSVLHGFLNFLLVNKGLLLTGGDENRIRIRKLAIFLNLVGGAAIIDCFSQTEIAKLLNAELQRIIK